MCILEPNIGRKNIIFRLLFDQKVVDIYIVTWYNNVVNETNHYQKGEDVMSVNESVNRYRLSVPADDEVVNEFMSRQHNSSFSVRLLIKMFVQKYGLVDATCIAFLPTGQASATGRRKRVDVEPSVDGSDERAVEHVTNEPSKPKPKERKPKENKKAKEETDVSASEIDALMDLSAPPITTPTAESAKVEPDENGFVNPDDFF